MAQDSFYQRLKFYNWLLNRGEGETIAEYGIDHSLPASTLARWHSRFDKDIFIGIIAKQVSSKNIREQVLKAIQTEALSGNIQAAKIILSEVDDLGDAGAEEELTVDQALKIIREVVNESRE